MIPHRYDAKRAHTTVNAAYREKRCVQEIGRARIQVVEFHLSGTMSVTTVAYV